MSKGESNSKSHVDGKRVGKILNDEEDVKPPEMSHDLRIAIQQGRQKKSLNQEKLAQALNVHKQVVASWEQGKSVPNIGQVLQMEKIFDEKLPRPPKAKKTQD